jgi:hypothetical protein
MNSALFWAAGAGLACAAEAGLAWRYNQALPPPARWQGYALGLGTLSLAVAGYALSTGQARRLVPVAVITAGGALGTLGTHAYYAAQDRADAQAMEVALHEPHRGARVGRALSYPLGTGERAGAIDRFDTAVGDFRGGAGAAHSGGRRAVPLYPRPARHDPGHARGSV